MTKKTKKEVKIELSGWKCKSCGNVYGYWVKSCPNCSRDSSCGCSGSYTYTYPSYDPYISITTTASGC